MCQVEGKSLCSWVLKIRYGGIIETVAAGLFQLQNLVSFRSDSMCIYLYARIIDCVRTSLKRN